jgi:transposase
MTRKFKTADYDAGLDLQVSVREVLPTSHRARFVVGVIAQLDLSRMYARYSTLGGEPFAPEILLGLLFYGYATGVVSSRRIEKATYESIPFRFIAGNLHPDHDTIAHFRQSFLVEIQELFVQVLLLAQELGVLKLGNISLDGTRIHADAAKSHAVSYARLLELETALRQQVAALLTLGEQVDQHEQTLPTGLVIEDEIGLRQTRLENLAKAKQVLQARAQERFAREQAEYQAKLAARAEKAPLRETKRKPVGRSPQPPQPEPRDKDQYNFTDPESRMTPAPPQVRVKNSHDLAFNQHYNAQAAVDQDSFLIVANTLSNHPVDQGEALPTVDAIPTELGTPQAAALDAGYFGAPNVLGLATRGIEPYIATGREPHAHNWQAFFAAQPAPLSDEANPQVKMAYKLQTEIGKAIYRLRKRTVEPVIGIIKEILGFRQFSLRGQAAAAGEWNLVSRSVAFNLKRLHVLLAP